MYSFILPKASRPEEFDKRGNKTDSGIHGFYGVELSDRVNRHGKRIVLRTEFYRYDWMWRNEYWHKIGG